MCRRMPVCTAHESVQTDSDSHANTGVCLTHILLDYSIGIRLGLTPNVALLKIYLPAMC